MRVSGGAWRGRVVAGLADGHRTRPTTGRVREAMFSMVAAEVPGSRVLDLFAGSGLLGLEALSRGAALAWFVEEHPATGKRIRQMLAEHGLAARTGVVIGPVGPATLQQVKTRAAVKTGGQEGFDLLFLDPPYGKGLAAHALALLPAAGLLAPGCVAVVEHEAGATDLFGAPWRLWKSRRYGDTGMTLLLLDHDEQGP